MTPRMQSKEQAKMMAVKCFAFTDWHEATVEEMKKRNDKLGLFSSKSSSRCLCVACSSSVMHLRRGANV
jgi:hypothetical protein